MRLLFCLLIVFLIFVLLHHGSLYLIPLLFSLFFFCLYFTALWCSCSATLSAEMEMRQRIQ